MFQLIGNICVNEMYTSILNSVAGILSVVIILTRSPLFIVQNYYKHTFRVYSYISYIIYYQFIISIVYFSRLQRICDILFIFLFYNNNAFLIDTVLCVWPSAELHKFNSTSIMYQEHQNVKCLYFILYIIGIQI